MQLEKTNSKGELLRIVTSLLSSDNGKKFFDDLRSRVYYLKDLKITPRVFNLWKNSGLFDLPSDVNSRKWIKLNFSDYIWLSLVKDMRDFGLPFTEIKKVKKLALQNIMALDTNVINEDTLKENIIQFMKDERNMSREETEKMMDELMKSSGVDTFYKVIEKQKGRELTVLECFLSLRGFCGLDSSLVIYINRSDTKQVKGKNDENNSPEDSIDEVSNIDFTFWSDLYESLGDDVSIRESLFRKPHIELPLSNYIENFIEDKKHFSKIKQMELLSKEEIKLIEKIREGRADQITIKFKGGKAEMIEVTNYIEGDLESKLLRAFSRNEYANIEYKVAGGKVQSFKKTVKYKVKDLMAPEAPGK